MAYKVALKCSNCSHICDSGEIAEGTDVATWLAVPGNATCSHCGCDTLVKA